MDYSDWALPTVNVKEKKIRVCSDFLTGLNGCLKDHSFPPPTPFVSLTEERYFLKIDLPETYLQVKVDVVCSTYLTIHTHRGLYALRRLLFGLKVAPSFFQQIMDAMLAGLDHVKAYLDDIQIKSENTEQHRKHVRDINQENQRIQF